MADKKKADITPHSQTFEQDIAGQPGFARIYDTKINGAETQGRPVAAWSSTPGGLESVERLFEAMRRR